MPLNQEAIKLLESHGVEVIERNGLHNYHVYLRDGISSIFTRECRIEFDGNHFKMSTTGSSYDISNAEKYAQELHEVLDVLKKLKELGAPVK